MNFKKLIGMTLMLGTAFFLSMQPTILKGAGDEDDPGYTMGSGYEVAVPGYEEEWEEYLKEVNAVAEDIPGSFETTSPYTGLTYTHNTKFAGHKLFHGVDVSKYQTNVDWKKAHANGIDFAIVRVAYRGKAAGTLNKDSYYEKNLTNAVANNVDVGVYIYSQAITVEEAVEEAEYVLDLIKGYKVKLPIVLDYEYGGGENPGRLYDAHLSAREQTDICLAFCRRVKEAGYTPMVYANNSMFTRGLYADELEKESILWFAKWSTSDATKGVPSELDYEYWQYGGDPQKGKVNGISGTVDVNFWYKDFRVSTKNVRATAQTDSAITIAWNKIKDADGYRIYQYNEETNSYQYVLATRNAWYQMKNLKSGTNYKYKIRPYWVIGGTMYMGNASAELNATTLPAQVQNIKTSERSENSLTLTWDAVGGATSYRIYMLDNTTISYQYVTSVSADQTSCKITGLDSVTEYSFKIRASRNYNNKEYMGTASVALVDKTCPKRVANVSLWQRGLNYLTLEWDSVPGADGYVVYRLNPETGKYDVVKSITSGTITTVKDTSLSAGTEYTYKVRAFLKYNNQKYYGLPSTAFNNVTTPKAVTEISATNRTDKELTISWNKVHGATNYAIFLYDKKTDTYKWHDTVAGSVNEYTFTKLVAITEYKVKIRPFIKYNGANVYAANSDEYKTITNPPKVTQVISTPKTSTSIQLDWKKVPYASGYKVYRYSGATKKYECIATIAGNENISYVDTGLSSAMGYAYRVAAYKNYAGSVFVGTQSDKVSATTTPGRVNNVNVTESTTNSISFTWNKVPRAQGYLIYRYSGKTKTYELYSTVTTNSFTDINLVSNISYKYKVVAYITHEGKQVCGVESDILTGRTQ